VSAELARRVYGSPAKAIGRTLVAGRGPTDGYSIVGVTADTKVRSLAESPRLMAYLPVGQSHVQEISAMIRGDVTTAASAGRTTLRALDADLPLMNNSTFEQYTSVALLPQRLAGVVSATLGLAGLLLQRPDPVGQADRGHAVRHHDQRGLELLPEPRQDLRQIRGPRFGDVQLESRGEQILDLTVEP